MYARRRETKVGETSTVDLDDLTRRARKGDRIAFDDLVRATYADTYTLAFRLTGNESDARDVTQDAYLRAYRAIGRFRGDAQVTTWLYRITANCASTTVLRRSKKRHESLDAPDIRERTFADDRVDSNPELAAEGALERATIDALIQRLPPRLRAVVVLRDAYDLPHDAIAKELGITETAAKVRLHRARKLLRGWLDETAGDAADESEYASSEAVRPAVND